jgi:hypothetical protein
VPPAVTLGNDLLPASFAHPQKGDQAELAKNIIQASSLQATGISSYPVVKVHTAQQQVITSVHSMYHGLLETVNQTSKPFP